MRKVYRFFIALIGAGIGCGIVAIVLYNFKYPGYEYVMRYTTVASALIVIYALAGILSGIIFYFIAPAIIDDISGFFNRIDQMPALDLLFGAAGMTFGLLIALLISILIRNLASSAWLSGLLTTLVYVLLGWFGCRVGVTRRKEILNGVSSRRRVAGDPGAQPGCPKVLDTSVIIDGRILDLCKTGFLEGVIVVPGFVLKELRHIADSGDQLKRSRGRRGLDILKELQEEQGREVRVEETDYEDVDEVDVKLLRLAVDMGGVLVTNDYNLNKVAAVQNMRVLNINDLANALRPVLLPGENLRLSIVREGKEPGQGVGYLEDGTLVIVENGRRRIGETVDLVVTSALQTSAGRMIFAKPRS